MSRPLSHEKKLAAIAATIVSPSERIPETLAHDGESLAFDGELREILGPPAHVELGRVLGEGGMGVVRLGTQRSLARQVAVKSVKARGPDQIARLLREAWVTGFLEHPNIVPIYDIVLDDAGAPMIVLKRIEGTEWSALLSDPAEVTRRFGVEDVLAWHVGVLVQVCNAIHFAHTRRILHRDLKPDNVMIGEFGEVYVLDWGIALSLGHDHGGRITRVSDAKELIGTPVYMAPEMLNAPSDLDERTDVYLLGAILCEIVTGHAPHTAETPMAVLLRAARSKPELPPTIDDELASIVRRAMARDPADRPASADALKKELTAYLEHRGSLLLARDAEARVVSLREAIANAGDDADARVRVTALFGECRFALEHALARWPDNPVAKRALRDAQLVMVEHELAQGAPERAREVLSAVTDPPEELAARVRDALAQAAQERDRISALATLAAKADPRIDRGSRALISFVFVSASVALPLLGMLGDRVGAGTWPAIAGAMGFLGVSGAIGAYAGRRFLVSTPFNRVAHLSFLVSVGATSAFHLGAYLAGIDSVTSEALSIAIWAAVAMMGVIALDLRLAFIPCAYLIAFFVAARWPEARYPAMSAALLVLLVNSQWLFRRQALEAPRATREP